jgi:hypothetical protein
MPGSALAVQDDPSHGPLDDGRLRADYLRDCFRGYDDEYLDAADAFEPWRALIASIDETQPDAVVVWGGDNVSEAIFLRMACWWLGNRPVRLLRTTVPAGGGRHYVAVHAPADLATLFASARDVSDAERIEFAEDFLRIRSDTGLVLRWEAGRILGLATDRYDPLLLEACTTEWTPAPRVVGTAMGRCDGHNLMSDLFFCSRLQSMIDAGRMDVQGSCTRLREYAVRLPMRPESPTGGGAPQLPEQIGGSLCK